MIGIFGDSAAAPTTEILILGNAGNTNDTTGYGGVGYDYHIGTYEVTNSQYTAFLNAKATTDTNALYNPNMGSSTHGGITRAGSSGSYTYSVKSGFENKPVNFVSFWDAARFSNWLTNGGGSGDTETGMYNLNGITNPTNNTVARQLDFSLGQNGVAIASENEWYKAAYYDGSGSYFDYPTQSNSITTADVNYANSVGTATGRKRGQTHRIQIDLADRVAQGRGDAEETSNRISRRDVSHHQPRELPEGFVHSKWKWGGFRTGDFRGGGTLRVGSLCLCDHE